MTLKWSNTVFQFQVYLSPKLITCLLRINYCYETQVDEGCGQYVMLHTIDIKDWAQL